MKSIRPSFLRLAAHQFRSRCAVISQQLRREGPAISRKSVQRQMQRMGLIAIGSKPNTNRSKRDHAAYPYLLRGLKSSWSNHIWCIEEVYPHKYDSPRAARKGLAGYFECYNRERLYQSLGYRIPAEAYLGPTLTRGGYWHRDARHVFDYY